MIKKLTTTIALSCALISPMTMADQDPINTKPTTQAAVADIWLDFSIKGGETTTIPIDTNGRAAFITVKVDCWSSTKGEAEVAWNGTLVNNGQVVKCGNAIVFPVNGSGTLTVKNMHTEPSYDEWGSEDLNGIYGNIVINIL